MIALTHGGYIAAGWIGTAVLVGGYALAVIHRGRKLSRLVPDEERRWS